MLVAVPRNERHRQSGLSRTLAALALLAMVVRALIPAGYMVAPAGQGRSVAVTLCSAHGAQTLFLDLDTGDFAPKKSGVPSKTAGGDAPCVFAMASALAEPGTPAALPAALPTGPTFVPTSVWTSPGRGLAAPPPWATGPPIAA